MDFFKFNGVSIPCSNDFAMNKSANIVASYQTMSGKTVADINGWTYADVTLQWDYLPESILQSLLSETNPLNGSFSFTFNDVEEGEKTVEAIRSSRVITKTRFVENGVALWRDIQMTLSFPACYH